MVSRLGFSSNYSVLFAKQQSNSLMNYLTIPPTVCKQANVTITVNNVDSDLRRIFLIIVVLKIICIQKIYPMKN